MENDRTTILIPTEVYDNLGYDNIDFRLLLHILRNASVNPENFGEISFSIRSLASKFGVAHTTIRRSLSRLGCGILEFQKSSDIVPEEFQQCSKGVPGEFRTTICNLGNYVTLKSKSVPRKFQKSSSGVPGEFHQSSRNGVKMSKTAAVLPKSEQILPFSEQEETLLPPTTPIIKEELFTNEEFNINNNINNNITLKENKKEFFVQEKTSFAEKAQEPVSTTPIFMDYEDIPVPTKGASEMNSKEIAAYNEMIRKMTENDSGFYGAFLRIVSEKAPYIFKHMLMPTYKQLEDLKKMVHGNSMLILEKIEKIENDKNYKTRYCNLYCTLRNWLNRDINDNQRT